MRSKLITAATTVASVVLAAGVVSADQVQEQLRLMEQRMAEMEDRLQATSDELKSAKTTVDEQQAMLSDAGLVETEEDGLLSGVGSFFEMVDVSGVVAASYNHRVFEVGDNDQADLFGGGGNGGATNDTFFTHRNADTFQLDQIWLTLDKTPTEESRGGFHIDMVWGETAQTQVGFGSPESGGIGGGGRDAGLIYTGYVSYLLPGDAVQLDFGKLATTLGAEVLTSNANFNVSNGVVFQNLQPFTHTGLTATVDVGGGVSLVAGVVNEVYRDVSISADSDKAGILQVQYGGDKFGVNIGAIVGQDPTGATCNAAKNDCNTSVFDVTATMSPTDNFEAWVNFDWVHSFGRDVNDGNAYGIAAAARVGVTDSTRIAARAEYLHQDKQIQTATAVGKDRQLFTLTGTLDQELTDGLHARVEGRWDREIEKDAAAFTSGNDDQVTGLVEMYYEF